MRRNLVVLHEQVTDEGMDPIYLLPPLQKMPLQSNPAAPTRTPDRSRALKATDVPPVPGHDIYPDMGTFRPRWRFV